MATRYLIGKGELLTYPIDPPPMKPNKVHPYTLQEAKAALLPQIEQTNSSLAELPQLACPDDLAVAKVLLHPSYVAKSFFPTELLRDAGLVSVGSKTVRITPRKHVQKNPPAQNDTTMLFIAGERTAFARLGNFANSLNADTRQAIQFAEIESIQPMVADDRIKIGPDAVGYYEVGLHLLSDADRRTIQDPFVAYAEHCKFEVLQTLAFQAGRMLFFPVRGNSENLHALARFTMLRVIRPMPKLRSMPSPMRSTSVGLGFQLPAAEPFSKEPKVAILDGGLPAMHPIDSYIGRYFTSDASAQDVPSYLDHGLGVTSAFLFGSIVPGQEAQRPYAYADHYRVLDAQSNAEDPLELYRTLGHVEEVLLSRQYQFVNLSLGPELPCEDSEVHVWTSVIDALLSDGETLMTVAAGNNGERDSSLGLDRIQVPADSVNALSVGAVDTTLNNWKRANYSARGPGRSPGLRKPDVVAFGGSSSEYFHHAVADQAPRIAPNLGTSFASPLVLRSAAGISAFLGGDVTPLTTKALLIHSSKTRQDLEPSDIGWGLVPSDLTEIITCGEGVARIIYQGKLSPGKYLRAPVPLPEAELLGKVELTATFCFASQVDPQDSSAYTKAGLDIKFRPHVDKKANEKATQPKTDSFFPSTQWRTEVEQRADLSKWETVLHAKQTYYGSSLKGSTFDIHYNARASASNAYRGDAQLIPYSLVLTLRAPKNPRVYDDILAAHARLQALESRLTLPSLRV